jgi:Zn-dependent peptidase ImmA (M78 family)
MTRPRPRIEIREKNEIASYNGVLEKPIIYLGNGTEEKYIENVLAHEYIHWVLHKRLGEGVCGLLDRVNTSEYILCRKGEKCVSSEDGFAKL